MPFPVFTAALIALTILQSSPTGSSGGRESMDRRRMISDLVRGKVPATNAEVQEVLAASLKDADPDVRRTAVGSIANILQLNAMPTPAPGQEWATRLKAVADALQPALEEAARDPVPGVRREALRGIAAPFAFLGPKAPLPLTLVKRFVAVFETDPDAGLRSMAVQGLRSAHTSADTQVRELAHRVLLQALVDPDPHVVQFAGWNAFESKAPEALPLLIAQLKNPSPVARMGVSAGIQGYGGTAAPYLPQMEEALAREPEGPTRKTLEATINLVRAGK